MADDNDDVSRLGFDASEAFATFSKLRKDLAAYQKSLNGVADATVGFNKEQSQVDEILKRASTFAELAAAQFRNLASAQNAAAKSSKNFNATQAKGPTKAARKQFGKESRAELEDTLFKGLRQKATLPEIVNFDKSLDQFQRLVEKTGVGTSKVKQILGDLGGAYSGVARQIRDAAAAAVKSNAQLGSKNVKAVSQVLRKVKPQGPSEDQLFAEQLTKVKTQRTNEGLGKIERALRDIVRGSKTLGNEVPKDLNKVDKGAKEVSISFSSIARIAATQFALQGFFSLVGLFKDGASAAKDYQLQLAAIQTLSAEFRSRSLASVGDTVAQISEQFGLPLEDVAAGLYETLSNQVGNAAESTRFLSDAATFSRASLTSMADSVDLLSAVLNSYNLNAGSAGDISGKLFKVIDLGRVKGEELANTIGRILPIASELGVSFDEVAATIAHLTIQGVKANEVYTLVSNTMLKLIKPTVALQAEFDKLGVASAEAGIQAFGFQGFLKKVTESTGTGISEVAELFNQIRGIRGVSGIVGKTGEDYVKTLEEIRNANEETAASAANLILSTPAAQLNRQMAEARSFLVNDFGQAAIDVFTKLISGIGGAKAALSAFSGVLAGIAVAGAVTGIKLLYTTVLAHPFIAVGVGLATFVAYVAALRDTSTQAADNLRKLNEQIDSTVKLATVEQKNLIKERQSVIDKAGSNIQQSLFEFSKMWNEDREVAFQQNDAINRNLANQLSKRTSLLNSFVGQLQAIQSRAEGVIKDLQNKNFNLKFDVGQKQFEQGLKGLDEPKQAESLVLRAVQVLNAAKKAADSGNKELAESLFSTAADAASRAADINAENQQTVNRVLQERIAFNNKLIEQEQFQATEASRIEDFNKNIASEVEDRIGKLKELNLLEKQGNKSRAEFDQIATQREQLAGEIDTLLGQATPGKLNVVLDTVALKTQIREISQGFTDPVTGFQTSLATAVDSQSNVIRSKLEETFKSVPLEFVVNFKTVTGQDLDLFDGGKKAQETVQKTFSTISTDLKNTSAIPQLTADVQKSIAAVQSLGQELAGIAGQQASVSRRDAFHPFGQGATPEQAAEVAAVGERIAAVITKITTAAQTGDTQSLKVIQQQLTNQEALARAAAGPLTPAGRLAQQEADALARLRGEAATLAVAVSTLEEPKTVDINVQPAITNLQRLEKAANDAKAALPGQTTISPAAAPGFARGGPIGPDTVRAALSPGEFVMNPRSTQRFYSQLVAMNRGSVPHFQNGGPVSNSFGDIKINIHGESAKSVDGRKLGQQLKRELRLKKVRGFQ